MGVGPGFQGILADPFGFFGNPTLPRSREIPREIGGPGSGGSRDFGIHRAQRWHARQLEALEVQFWEALKVAHVFVGTDSPIKAAQCHIGMSSVNHVWSCDKAAGSKVFSALNHDPQHWHPPFCFSGQCVSLKCVQFFYLGWFFPCAVSSLRAKTDSG